MKKYITAFLLFLPFWAIAQDCPDYSKPSDGKALKIVFYTETAECFSISDKSGAVNPSPSKRVEFYVAVAPNKFNVVLANGTEMEKKLLANDGMASMVFEITYNEKKDSWDIKSRFGQAEETAEAKKKREDDWAKQQQDQKDAQAKRDKEWNDKIEADKKNQPNYYTDYVEENKKEEAEKKAEEERKAEEKRIAEENAKKTIVKTETDTTTSTHSSSTTNTSNTTSTSSNNTPTEGANTYKVRFLCDGKPIANTFVSLKSSSREIIASGMTDGSGKVEFKTDATDGKLNADLYGERDNYDWSITGIMTFNVNTKNVSYTDVDIYPFIKFIAEQMGGSPSSMAESWGLK